MKRYEARPGLHYGRPRWTGYIDGQRMTFMGLVPGDSIPCVHLFRWTALFHAWVYFKIQGSNHAPEWQEYWFEDSK